ncbi:MAG: PRC-barrel domain-containing protein [Planctomycetota bacterium]
MLRSLRKVLGYRVHAVDAEFGQVEDVYFDDYLWTVRYFVVDTVGLFGEGPVLISPQSVGDPEWEEKVVPVSLSREQIESSPDIDADLPVSRQHEAELAAHFDWSPYWVPPGDDETELMTPPVPEAEELPKVSGDPDLRSLREVVDYHVRASDGEVGHVHDLIADTRNWVVRYLVVDTRRLLPGGKVLVSPGWTEAIDWDKAEVELTATRDQIKQSPRFDPSTPINRKDEVRLYDYYGRPGYW